MIMASDAERQRRSRKHRAGDHSLCDPEKRCVQGPLVVAPVPTTPVSHAPPDDHGFGPSGSELWRGMVGVEMGPAHRVLLVEACRIADRLDRFHDTLAGGRWFFDRRDEDERVEVVIDQVLSEARQHALGLKALVAELEPKPTAGVAAVPVRKRGAGVVNLADRVAARRGSNSAG